MSASSGLGEPEGDTLIERLNNNDELFEAMLSMPTSVNEEMVESRREELFSIFWEEMSMSREEVLSLVREREEDFIEEYAEEGDALPEWLMRAEAQDVLLGVIHQKYEEEGLI